MALRLFSAVRLAPLRDHLVDALRAAPLDPLMAETIVVQSQGMRRWLTLQIADALGCAASLTLPFPARFIRELDAQLHVGQSGEDIFARDVLAWRIDALLRERGTHEDAAPLRTYLRDADPAMRFGLAETIAARFDEYQLYRPDVLAAWESHERAETDSPHERWQRWLWRALCVQGNAHLGTRLTALLAQIERGVVLPVPRLTVFGVNTMPPRFVELLAALGARIDVNVYAAVAEPGAVHPLRESFGAQARSFRTMLLDAGAIEESLDERPRAAPTVLHTLQHELLTGNAGSRALAVRADDDSLRVHDAPGVRRELEVIRDQLLDAFARDETLRPHDVLLLVPDVEAWAPAVDVVFGSEVDRAHAIPYRIADRAFRAAEPAAEALRALLELERGRLTHSELFAALAHPTIAAGAELTAAEIAPLQSTTAAANIRWGYDGAALSAVGLPPLDSATWRAGLDRLILGAATGRTDAAVLDSYPIAGDGTGDREAIGRLALWVDDIAATLRDWSLDRSLAAWEATLHDALTRFVVPVDRRDAESVRAVRETLRGVGRIAALSGHVGDVPFRVVRDWLDRTLADDSFGSGFLQGGMTVAALKPMRSIPFRVIAVAGLDDVSFPRRDRRVGFDLLELAPRAGDRTLRDDDRQLFLDLLLAAEDRLILSYSGRAVRDHSPRAPSIVLDELLDHCETRAVGARATMVVQHPLQPFSPRYHDGRDPRLLRYATEVPALASPGAPPRTTHSASAVRTLSLTQLVTFWSHPAKWYCNEVLRFWLPSDLDVGSDDETLVLDTLEHGLARANLLQRALAGGEIGEDALRDRMIAHGALGPGALGAAQLTAIGAEVTEAIAGIDLAARRAPVEVRLHAAQWELSGSLDGIFGDVRYIVRGNSLAADRHIRALVEHLVMCAAAEQQGATVPTRTIIRYGNSKKRLELVLERVAGAMQVLEQWIDALNAATVAPPAFFPVAGIAWYQTITSEKKGAGDPYAKALDAFEKKGFNTADGDAFDPYVRTLFRDDVSLSPHRVEFERLASLLFSPFNTRAGARR